jgi:hypothetical protein
MASADYHFFITVCSKRWVALLDGMHMERQWLPMQTQVMMV